jgi:hypothetical protein
MRRTGGFAIRDMPPSTSDTAPEKRANGSRIAVLDKAVRVLDIPDGESVRPHADGARLRA